MFDNSYAYVYMPLHGGMIIAIPSNYITGIVSHVAEISIKLIGGGGCCEVVLSPSCQLTLDSFVLLSRAFCDRCTRWVAANHTGMPGYGFAPMSRRTAR